MINLGKGKNKKVELSLLVHPQWLASSPKQDANGQANGGSAQDDVAGKPYSGRFFAAYGTAHARQYDAALAEWEARKDDDLRDYWPRSKLAYGFMTHHLQGGVPNHGFTHWWTMLNPRQLLILAQLLKTIVRVGSYDWEVREFVLGAYQQYLRNQNMYCFWDISRDCLAPHLSNNNFHPKNNVVENCVLPALGRGNWSSSVEGIIQGREWAMRPWEAVSIEALKRHDPALADQISGKSEKVYPGDPVGDVGVFQGSSTDLAHVPTASLDLVLQPG